MDSLKISALPAVIYVVSIYMGLLFINPSNKYDNYLIKLMFFNALILLLVLFFNRF
jgi:hypothetical protein